MIDPYAALARWLRREWIAWRLRRVCPHPDHRVFPFQEQHRIGTFCDDCQATLTEVPAPWTPPSRSSRG